MIIESQYWIFKAKIYVDHSRYAFHAYCVCMYLGLGYTDTMKRKMKHIKSQDCTQTMAQVS